MIALRSGRAWHIQHHDQPDTALPVLPLIHIPLSQYTSSNCTLSGLLQNLPAPHFQLANRRAFFEFGTMNRTWFSQGVAENTFAARGYLQSRFQEDSNLFPINVVRVAYYNSLYKKYLPEAVLDYSSSKALDIGCGPTLSAIIGLSPYVTSFVLSEYEQANITELEMWKDRSPKAFNWSPFISAVMSISEYDSQVDRGFLQYREEEIRKKISDIIPCDVRTKEIIDPKYIPKGGFDVVTSMGVLTTAASSLSELQGMLENINSLMKPGGLLVFFLSGRCTYYVTDISSTKKYPVLYVTEDDAHKALAKAGFDVKEIIVTPEYTELADVKQVYLCVGLKQ